MDNFMKELEEGLRGEVSEGVLNDTLSYYRNYFTEQKAKGLSEKEIADSLGSGRMIARSIIDANRTENRETINIKESEQEKEAGRQGGSGMFSTLKTVAVIAAVVIVVLFVVGLFFRLVWTLLPIVLVILLIVWLVNKL